MNKKIYKLLALLLALVTALTLFACGGEDGGEDSGKDSDKGSVNEGNEGNDSGDDPSGDEGQPSGSTLEKNGDGLYMIYTVEDLLAYRTILEDEMVACLEADTRFQTGEATSGAILMADIDMSSVCGPDIGNWRPIGVGVNENQPRTPGACLITFDGNGHSISGLYMKTTETGGGLFAYLQNAVVTNLTFKNTTLDCEYGAGGDNPSAYFGTGVIAMRTASTQIKNCMTESDVTVSGKYSVGGFVGLADEGGNLFEKCVNNAAVTAREGFAGGIAGQVVRTTDIFYCDNYGTISGDQSSVGGIAGRAGGSSSYAGNILGCVNYGTIVNVYKSTVCGIVGDNNSTVYFCINMGDIQAGGGKAYDITDTFNGSMRYCINTGKVYDASSEDKYVYVSEKREGFNLSPDDPALTDGSLLEKGKLGSYYWTQGEKFPVWNGTMP